MVMAHPSMAGATPPPPLTLAEWADEEEAGEFVDGQIVEDEEVGVEHDSAGCWLIWILRSWLGERGFMGMSDTRFGVSPTRGRKPDTYVYLPGRKPPPRIGLVTTPPDIMVEIVSPRPKDARRDRVEKMREYAAFGVRFYWIVDPAIRTFEIFELGADGRYAVAASATEGKIDPVPGCEGLVVDVDALWAELDRLDDGRDLAEG